jgi:NAD-dependent dihydropyrimidine dehydrogenase PreA subunit
VTYRIVLETCFNCGLCRRVCPTEAIKYYTTGSRTHIIDEEWCVDCDLCAKICPVACIASHPAVQPAAAQLELARAKARGFAKKQRADLQAVDARIEAFVATTPAGDERRIDD